MRYFIFVGMILLAAACRKPYPHPEPICCASPAADTTQKSLPARTSVYQLPGTWETSRGGQVSLAQLQGKIQIVTMIFTHCGYACPRTVENMKEIEDQLPPAIRKQVGFVLITFDTARDSVSRLAAFAAQKELGDNWTLLKGMVGEIRSLSMLLDVQYARLPSGDFSHSNVITVLGGQGQIVRRLEGLDLDAKAIARDLVTMMPQY